MPLAFSNPQLLKIGVIGTGKMGQYHCNLLSQWKRENHDRIQIELVGLHDVDAELSLKLAQQYQTAFFRDPLKLLAKVDAVIVAASTAAHFNLAKLVLAQKKHLLIEKPLTENLKQAKELFALAEKNQLILQIGHVERYNASILALHDHYTIPLFWESRRMSKPAQRNINSGVCTDLLTHDVDLFFRFCGKHLSTFAEVEISALGKKVISNFEDIVIAQIKIPANVSNKDFHPDAFILAHFTASRVHHRQERTLTLQQTQNTLDINLATQELQFFEEQQAEPQKIIIAKNNALQLEIIDFVNKIKSHSPNDATTDLLVLETILALKESLNI